MKKSIFIPIAVASGNTRKRKKLCIQNIREYFALQTLGKLYVRGDKLKAIINFYYAPGSNPIDIDNLLKVVFDSLKGKLFADDRDIREVHARLICSHYPDEKIGFDVRVFPLKG